MCICLWPETCGGMGALQCEGCGGDLCVCGECYGHGEMPCPGCEDCNFGDLDYFDENEPDEFDDD